ncbi:glutamate--tRNA ligase [Methanopyrus kandleri]|uniref:Glutamate--tRNA ligase n=2 Tax=Methanopyrus kandleri TaxID=2320 RepID=SYE_METKA|nr:glutamate--tRNA ligase [Methanopyrus kandleri]Q8TXB7.1 RecName: Full=Glutamate--tRNA ligase; AltName: Full=Glutamyl-tRNA synthetase; Short=GluRS [Methanopyrus kandleri AV19]AAM01971.1 Glutamyl-tRNA synthetase [Methanopyrus kandleri AV19]HII70016.1 glutamate--tRNA ligase [Methanopyrus kandleri]
MEEKELRDLVRRYALENAARYGGRANPNAVMKKIMKEHEELRPRAKEVLKTVREVVREVNKMSGEEIRRELEELGGPREDVARDKEGLKPLPGAEPGNVRLRFAPNPSGPLHIGHARAAVLNDEYARRYDGTLVLRIEDTDPRRVDPEAYDMIEEDLEWLGVNIDERYVQSNRIELYYMVCEELLEREGAYVCTCDPDEFRRLRDVGRACPCRSRDKEENLELWEEMLDGTFSEGEAVVRVKTEVDHPDPAVREWIAFRIVEEEHPMTGSRYLVWPTMNFAVAVDDHLMNITHVLRGKDHESNTRRQKYVFEHLGWDTPEYVHYGILKVEGAVLSTSEIRRGIDSGEYTGWDDVRVATLRALRRRGIKPEAIRETILEIGLTDVDATFSWEHLYARNRKMIDPESHRYFFVRDPVELRIEGMKESVLARLPLHPDRDEGERVLILHPENGVARALLDGEDAEDLWEGDVVRLMNAVNVEIEEVGDGWLRGRYHSDDYRIAKEEGAQIVHWVPPDQAVRCEVVRPDGSVESGYAEINVEREQAGSTVQFERLYFVRLEEVSSGGVRAVYAHD